jgi:drug/metabolite transporter (DMT)-like permease
MYFLFALISTISYALHNTVMAPYYRNCDRLESLVVRGLGVSVAMIPVLFLSTLETEHLRQAAPFIITAAAFAIFANWCVTSSFKYLPIGIASALNMSIAAVSTSICGAVILEETVSLRQSIWMALIFGSIFALGISKMPTSSLTEYSSSKGSIAAFGFGSLIGVAYTVIAKASRLADPIAVAFLWESNIALFGVLIVVVRSITNRRALVTLHSKQIGGIVLNGIPAALGTICYALAVANGPVSIVTAVLATVMVANSFFAWLLYREQLTKHQVALIAFATLTVIGLKLFGT